MIDYTFPCPTEESEKALDALQVEYATMRERAERGEEILSSDTARLARYAREFALTLSRHLWALEQGGANAD